MSITDYRTDRHDQSECSSRWHCEIHGLAEQVDRRFRWCFECGHWYETPADLRRAYRREYPEPQTWREFAVAVWRCLTVRASKIPFCPLCMHGL